ncbi:hypothetical protein Pst134EA_019402 [Puccinia striiformis f. sp. tritici]|uniref:hypothetical protein n=1 Tax=Puccinia striiformis f. sp. tritici TaxID=168172 RepID=UPI0020084905|nr:hypothetical protein Pst134EA_019402 [Puccinia striiformis f. sp. tritici]KAH9459248.1 hypothetical protein Pst134EA_019402 [Puccinia striiformis f. sp. tritici]
MAFVRDLVSVLMVCISYQAVVAYPRGAELGLLEQYRTKGGAATAQSFSKLSTSCQLAASSLLSGEFGTCADLMGLVSILETKESIISPINTWVTDACSVTPCDEAGLASARKVIKKGCAVDLEERSVAAVALYSIITHYNATRKTAPCLPSVLGNVEERSGEKITVAEVVSLISGKLSPADRAFIAVSKEAYCTDCAHAIVSQSAAMIDAIKKDSAGIKFEYAHDKHMHQASVVCGPSFEDRKLPHTVQIAEPKSEDSKDD